MNKTQVGPTFTRSSEAPWGARGPRFGHRLVVTGLFTTALGVVARGMMCGLGGSCLQGGAVSSEGLVATSGVPFAFKAQAAILLDGAEGL